MSLKTRVIKLETETSREIEPINIAIFTAAPGVEPVGYVCGDVLIFRKPGESEEDLKTRCIDTVTCPEGNGFLVFDLLETTLCHQAATWVRNE